MAEKREGSTLLKQPDLGGGQSEGGGRPPGTEAVGRFATEGVAGMAPVEGGRPPAEEPGVDTAPDEVRGALYDGPERRKAQADWGRWQEEDRRVRPFVYANQQRT